MFRGALWCGGGILVTVVTYLAAENSPGGGTYVVAWGAILFGAIQFFRGLTGRNERPDPDDASYAALAGATLLEKQGRVQEAMDAYKQIAETYPGRPVGRDAQNSLEDLRTKTS